MRFKIAETTVLQQRLRVIPKRRSRFEISVLAGGPLLFASMAPNHKHRHQPSDYETDGHVTGYISDAPPPQPPPSRTNDELNFAVLNRHNPLITSILSIAPYAVIYAFSTATSSWEKIGVEGTLFVCQLETTDLGMERYCVVVLNRRGLDNFDAELTEEGGVEVSGEYVILRSQAAEGDENEAPPMIYGLWIFAEPEPSSTARVREENAQVIKDCAVRAGMSRRLVEEHMRDVSGNGASRGVVDQEDVGSHAMGRQISLQQLFGQQRTEDDAWSVKVHSPQGPLTEASPQTAYRDIHAQSQQHDARQAAPQFVSSADTDFFRSAPRHGQAKMPQSIPDPISGQDALLNLFRQAQAGYQGVR